MLKRSPLKKTSTLKAKSFLTSKSSLKANSTLKSGSTLCANSILNTTKPMNKRNSTANDKWLDVRKKALARDKNKCIVCGRPATEVHHIHLRSNRKDLVYNLNNLVSLCSKHHMHRGSEKYKEQTELIARVKNMSVENLLKFAETANE